MDKAKESFKEWKMPLLTDRLLKEGFFYTGKEDIVKCLHCNIEIKNWSVNSDPKNIHKKLSPYCSLYKKENFSNLADRLNSYKNAKFLFKVSTDLLAKAGFFYCGYRDTVQCCTCDLKVYDWTETDDPFVIHKMLRSECEYLHIDSNIEPNQKCDVCTENYKDCLIRPCKHVTLCISCSLKINSCPICCEPIKNREKIFLT